MNEIGYSIFNWIASVNYQGIALINSYWWVSWAFIFFIGSALGMAPLKAHHDQSFFEIILVYIRKMVLIFSLVLLVSPVILFFIYGMTVGQEFDYTHEFFSWFFRLAEAEWFYVIPGIFCALVFRFLKSRHFMPFVSNLKKRFRKKVVKDKPTDIREESAKRKEKDFVPAKYYKKDNVFMALDESDVPVYVPLSTWYETNMQVIGPTRFGKGILLGTIMDQAIRRGDSVFYIDPKSDAFAPHIMYQACLESGRKFIYLTLHDDGIGKWAPFTGGSERDGLARLERAFGLEFTGDPGTDYYKSQERRELVRTFKETRNLDSLLSLMEEKEDSRITAELSRWKEIESLRPRKGKGFSIEKALKENVVVYVQGHLDDDVVKTATKIFIIELIQEARRLQKERSSHLTAVVDEVSFLVSKELAQALATAVGFQVNFVLAYQSQNDLLNIEDKNVNPRYVHNSINVNSQIKAVYGGADEETAKWVAGFSGTISKNITKIERADISAVGGEKWENQRAVGPQEENYINTNTILSLPPRINVFKQPRKLAIISYTSFVPVRDMQLLESYVVHKQKVYGGPDVKRKSDNSKTEDEKRNETVKGKESIGKKCKTTIAKTVDSKFVESVKKMNNISEDESKKPDQKRVVKGRSNTASAQISESFLPPKLKSDDETMALLENIEVD